MNEWIDRRQRIWAALAVIGGVALFLGLELRKEPGMSGLEVAVELLGIVPVVLTSVGLVLFFKLTRRQREQQQTLIRDLELARAQGHRWRSEARPLLNGLGQAIEAQISGGTSRRRNVRWLSCC